jgi:uncharacterized protein (DUF2147 family)
MLHFCLLHLDWWRPIDHEQRIVLMKSQFLSGAILGAVLMSLPTANAARATDISGLWLTDTGDAHIRMAKCGAGMCGTIVWLKEPKDPATGKPPTDEHNHDPAKRSRPILGLPIALDFRPSATDPGRFEGHFYNADDGNTYQGNITMPNANELHVQGCLAVFCQTQVWTRVKR